MNYNYQYPVNLATGQKLTLNHWLRICQYWYNRQLGERFDWWQLNRCPANLPQGAFCRISCSIGGSELKDNPSYYSQKKQLPILKQDLLKVNWSGELLDFTAVPSQTLQEVCTRVKLAFNRYIRGDKNGKRSGKPRFKNTARFRSMVFEGAKLHSCSVGGRFLYVTLPKLGEIKVRRHRPLPEGAVLKSVQLIKKADGWYINLRLEDNTVPQFKPEIKPTWGNSLGMDAVLHDQDYLATSEGTKLPALKSFRKSEAKLAQVSRRKAAKKKGSRSRRKLAKREARVHQRIARARRDHAYKTAHALMRTGKQVFFHEKLNLKGLCRKNKVKKDDDGQYLPNGQSAKSGLNKSWADAAFGQFFNVLSHIAAKAGAVVTEVSPRYTSQLLSYRDEFVFTDLSHREYWDEELKLKVDRDINSGINVKRVGLGLFPTISRRKGKPPVIVQSVTQSTLKEVLPILTKGLEKPAL